MSMPTEDMRKRVIRTGFFVEGKLVSWECTPPDLVKVMGGKDAKVMCGDVEVVPWTEAMKRSLAARQWIKA